MLAKKIIKSQYLWLIIIVFFGLVFRFRNFLMLPIDAHAMRQTDTECVAYFLAKGEASMLYPKSCLIRPVDNFEGYFFLEFPAYEAVIALNYRIFGYDILVVRLVNLVLYVLAGVSLWWLVKEWFGNKLLALLALFTFSLAPGSIFFLGHAVHPDLFAVFSWLLGIAILLKKKNIFWIILAGLLLGLSVATRPFILIGWPLVIAVLFKKKYKWFEMFCIFGLMLGIYGWWRWWIWKLGVNVVWENWVLSGGEGLFNLGLLKNLIWKNMVGEVMGKAISLMAVIGLVLSLVKKDFKMWPFWGWLAMVPIYWGLVFEGNLTHQYYADVYIVPVVVLAAYGLVHLVKKNVYITVFIIILIIINGWRTSQYYFNDYDKQNIDIANEIEKMVPENKKIIYLYRANSVPLSLAHRQGWIVGEWPTDVGSHAWSVVQMKPLGVDLVVLPKVGYPGLVGEDLRVVLQNLEIVVEGKYIKVYRFK